MKLKKFNEVKPYLMGEHLILSLNAGWLQVFQGFPTFEVFINDSGKLCLISKGNEK